MQQASTKPGPHVQASPAVPEAIMAQAIPVAAVPAEAMAEAFPAAAIPMVAVAEAVPAVAMAEAAVAEAEVTLRELQEALEEEMLTRQSLSRELEAIRAANRNFARWAWYQQGIQGEPGPLPDLLPVSSPPCLLPRSQLQEAQARNRDLEALVRQLQERMELLQAPGAAGESPL